MHVVSDGGGGVVVTTAGGQRIELSIDDLRDLGKRTSSLSAEALTARSRVEETVGQHGAFGTYGPAQTLAAQHDAVAAVFSEALSGLQTEMDEFGVAITQAADNYAEADDATQAALAALAARFPAGGKGHTHEALDLARRNAGSGLEGPSDEERAAAAQAEGLEEADLEALGHGHSPGDAQPTPVVAPDLVDREQL